MASAPLIKRTQLFRNGVSIALTIGIILLPPVGAQLGYSMMGEPIEPDLVRGGMIVAAAMAGLAWIGLVLVRLVGRMNIMAATATRGGGFPLTDPAMIQSILATQDVQCSRCGYNLRGLPAGPCPECREPIVLNIAGADPLRPIIWLTRLAVVVYVVCASQGIILLWFVVQRWSYVIFALPGRGTLRMRVGMLLHPGASILGLLILGLAVAAWVRAEPGRPRAVSRWRVLNTTVALLGLTAVAQLVGWLLQI